MSDKTRIKYLKQGVNVFAALLVITVLYFVYYGYRYETHEKHAAQIDVTVDFIPSYLCGREFEKEKVINEEDIAKWREVARSTGMRFSNRDYYLGFTVHNESTQDISVLVAKTEVYAPFDKDLNPRASEPIGSATIIFESKSYQDRKLGSGQYLRKCAALSLNRDYSEIELTLLRRKTALTKVGW